LVLRFNQRVRPEDVVAHVHIALTHAAQSTVVGLEPTFFVTGVSCEAACSPSRYSHLNFTIICEYADGLLGQSGFCSAHDS
jgi:hypothetical protein